MTTIQKVPLSEYSEQQMYRYIIETATERAIPDVVDGLKPVQRRILYAASKIARNAPIKTARVVGETLGKYHPHADDSIADSIATMVSKQAASVLLGSGQWGSRIDPPAAPRYNAVGLSEYGRMFVLPDYMDSRVTSYVPNYDDKEIEPVVLPAPLPHVLLSGISGIAAGAATEIPAFTIDSMIRMLTLILSGKKVSIADFAKTLKPAFPDGGELVKSAKNKQEWKNLFVDSKARLEYIGKITVNEAKKQLILDQWPPGSNPERVIEKVRSLPECGKVWTSKGSISFTVPVRSNVSKAQFLEFAETVQDLCKSSISYNMNVTHRTAKTVNGVTSYSIKLRSMSVPEMIKTWLVSRLNTEKRALAYRISKQQEAIDHTDLILYATSILDIIRKAWDAPNFQAYLIKHTKCTADQAKILGDFRLEALSKLSKTEWQKKRKSQMQELAQLKKWKNDPKAKMLLDISQYDVAKMMNTGAEQSLTLG